MEGKTSFVNNWAETDGGEEGRGIRFVVVCTAVEAYEERNRKRCFEHR